MTRLILLLSLILSFAASCESSDPDDGRDPDNPRCGYLLPNRSLYDICVENPFPTELHPATSFGANTISCYINDTIVFRNWRPALMGRPDAEARRYDEDSTQFQIFGTYENFQEIDRRRVTFYLPLMHEDSLYWRSNAAIITGFGPISGDYIVAYDLPYTIVSTLNSDGIVYGTFDIWLRHQHDSAKTLHLTDGRFDVRWYWF